MYDALEDTPRDFQTKLIDALNSLGETMQIPPTEAFNKVLCKSSDDENEDVKKKLYNWWRAFFEVLVKCEKVPTERVSEFNQKIDDLMAEIMKAGDAEASTEEEPVMESSTKPRFKKGDFVVVRNGDDARVLRAYRDRVDKSIWYEVWIMDGNRTTEFPDEDVYASRKEYEAKYLYEEEYEQATKDDEDKMLADMDFAIQHLGEVANKVKAIVNFINPYCEASVNEGHIAKPGRFGIGDHVLYKGEECVVVDVDEDLRNDEEIYQVSKDSDKVDGLSFREWVTWDEIEPVEGFTEEVKKTMKFKKIDESNNEWVAEEDSGSDIVEHMMELGTDPDFIVEISGNKVLSDGAVEFQCIYKRDSSAMEEEPSEVKDLIKNEVEGMLEGTGWGVRNYEFPEDDDDLMISWDSDKEPYAAFKVVVEQKMVELEKGKLDESNLENELDKGDDGWVEIGQPVGESNPVELEGTDWKDLTEKLDANELADSLNGWEDRSSKKLVVCDAFASGSDIVNVDVLTVTDKRDEVMKMASEYLLGNVENWQVGDASEPRKDENGQFYTELILKPKYEEVAENNDEVKSGEVKDGEKQVTQDGDTKTLVAGEEKKPICEMTIEQDINNAWNLTEYLWGQGKENLEELLRTKFVEGDAILQLLEDMGVRNLTNINDLFAYDFPSVLDSLGLDGHAWNQNMEFKRKGEEDEDDEDEDEG